MYIAPWQLNWNTMENTLFNTLRWNINNIFMRAMGKRWWRTTANSTFTAAKMSFHRDTGVMRFVCLFYDVLTLVNREFVFFFCSYLFLFVVPFCRNEQFIWNNSPFFLYNTQRFFLFCGFFEAQTRLYSYYSYRLIVFIEKSPLLSCLNIDIYTWVRRSD